MSGQMGEVRMARGVVALREDLAGFCWWARLDNGLELRLDESDLFVASRASFLGPLHRIGWALGLHADPDGRWAA